MTWQRCCLVESQWQGCANLTWCQKSWQGQHFVNVLKSGGSFAKIIRFEICPNWFVDFQLRTSENCWRKSRTKWSLCNARCIMGSVWMCPCLWPVHHGEWMCPCLWRVRHQECLDVFLPMGASWRVSGRVPAYGGCVNCVDVSLPGGWFVGSVWMCPCL